MHGMGQQFANAEAIDYSGTIYTLKARASSYIVAPVRMVVPHQAGFLSPAPLYDWLVRMLSHESVGLTEDQITAMLELINIRCESAPSLRSYIDNHSKVVRGDTLPLHTDTTPCPCLSGPFKRFVDPAVGHVLVHDSSILASVSARLDDPGIGLNFKPRPSPQGMYFDLPDFQASLCDALGDCSDDVYGMHPFLHAGIHRLRRAATMPLYEARESWPYRVQRSFRWSPAMHQKVELIHQHLMVTCLDKLPGSFCFVCVHWASEIVKERLTSPAFASITEGDADSIFDIIVNMHEQLGVDAPSEAVWAYLYPTLKRHKCMQHEPTMLHKPSCSLAWRHIANCSVGCASYFIGTVVSALFSAVDVAVNAHRDHLTAEAMKQHGIYLQYRFAIDSWQELPLNLPERVPADYTLLTGDVKKAFENIPLDGPDALSIAVNAAFEEAYDWTGKDLYVSLTEGGGVGKACFARGTPPCFGNVSRWLHIPLALAMDLADLYSRITVIRDGQFLAVQLVGVPMGGPPCSQYCKRFLDFYCKRLADRINTALFSLSEAQVKEARILASLIEFLFIYADDLFAITKPDFCERLLNPAAPRSDEHLAWLFPLRDDDESVILDFESEPAAPDETGVISVHFLCMTISLRAVSRHGAAGATVPRHRVISYKPYNVRSNFTFQYPTLTRYDSFTPSSTLRASLSTMVPYAIIGCSSLEPAVDFIRNIICKLRRNGFPKAWLLDMWEKAEDLVYRLPCREPLASQREQLIACIYGCIRDLCR